MSVVTRERVGLTYADSCCKARYSVVVATESSHTATRLFIDLISLFGISDSLADSSSSMYSSDVSEQFH